MLDQTVFRNALDSMSCRAIELLTILYAADDFVTEKNLAKTIGVNPGQGLSQVLRRISQCVEDAGGQYEYRAKLCVEREPFPLSLRLRNDLRPVMTEYLNTENGKQVLHSLLKKLVRQM